MKFKVWGSQGSVAGNLVAPNSLGSNTPCVSVELDNGEQLVLDAGSGIIPFALFSNNIPKTLIILLSHLHWDHIEGLPMALPSLCKKTSLTIAGDFGKSLSFAIETLFNPTFFPVALDTLNINLVQKHVCTFLKERGIVVKQLRLNHAVPCYGYRIFDGNKSLVYCTDNEIKPEAHAKTLVKFCHKADILIHDSQYLDSEKSLKKGLGHSFASDVADLAQQAEVKSLVLFHHEPFEQDIRHKQILNQANKILMGKIPVQWAKEGETFSL